MSQNFWNFFGWRINLRWLKVFTHQPTCVFVQLSGDMQTDSTFVLSHFILLNVQMQLHSHSESQTCIQARFVWALTLSPEQCVLSLFLWAMRSLTLFNVIFLLILICNLDWVWCPLAETIAVTFCYGQSFREKGGKIFLYELITNASKCQV